MLRKNAKLGDHGESILSLGVVDIGMQVFTRLIGRQSPLVAMGQLTR
jgi:hypothetical protein